MDKEDNQGLEKFILDESMSVYDAMITINRNGHGIAFVCDDNLKLLAAVTDGDVRRFIISGGQITNSLKQIANYSPHTCRAIEEAKNVFREIKVNALPMIDSHDRLLSVVLRNYGCIGSSNALDVPVVVIAGGKGLRMQPHTRILPKPLLPVGEKTLVEQVLDSFYRFGCSDFTLIVNYKRDLIKAYFAEGKRQYEVKFVDEREFLGTGGGLALLKGNFNSPFFFINCDTLISADFKDIYNRHVEEGNVLTMVCATIRETVPYGVVELSEHGKAIALREKPSYDILANTGMYVIQPEFLNAIQDGMNINITDLIQRCIECGEKIGVYSIDEKSWTDMGAIESLGKENWL